MNRRTKSGKWAMWLGAALLFSACGSRQPAPRIVHLRGSVSGATYTSADGAFAVSFPVSGEVGGRILGDSAQSVTFVDNWGSRVTFAGLPVVEHSSMMTMLKSQGREKALREFARREYGDLITVHYHPEARGGMISFIYLRPASPKTGVAIFVQAHRLFTVETDMLPGVQLLAQSDAKSESERDTWLEGRAVALAETIEVK